MMNEFLLAILVPPILLLGWVFVQNAWRHQFGGVGEDDDVLARRGGCGACKCTKNCQRNVD